MTEGTEAEETMIHVFDLPQLYHKPSPESLLKTLELLTLATPSWEGRDASGKTAQNHSASFQNKKRVVVHKEGVTRYLTQIVGSSLHWITDDESKEEIWNQASLRLSERSGRSAMSSLTRSFSIPTSNGRVEITLHEPTLTADNLGLKTWTSSFQLAKNLYSFREHLPADSSKIQMLELGSGTGLVGIAAAVVYGTTIFLTDLPDIVPNLSKNLELNQKMIQSSGGQATAVVLDWQKPNAAWQHMGSGEPRPVNIGKFRIVLAADPLYSSEHPSWLANTVFERLEKHEEARFIIELPLREAYAPEVNDFKNKMHEKGFKIIANGNDLGVDDWGWDGDDDTIEQDEVNCWWSVWAWA